MSLSVILIGILKRARRLLGLSRTSLRETRRRLDAVLEMTRDGVLMLSPAGVVLTLNSAASQMLAVDPATSVGRSIQQLGIFLIGETGKSLNPEFVLVNSATRAGGGDAPGPELVGISRPNQAARCRGC